jgi:hypoxanthine phosphoribosyltransferase
MVGDIEEILLTEEEIKARVAALGQQISRDYAGKEIILICILKGAVTFMADLARAIAVPTYFDFMAVSSYGLATETSGVVRILKDLDRSVEEKNILLVEDIIDTGLTLNYLLKNLQARKPASLKICALLDKPKNRRVDVNIDYTGFVIPDKFVVGYGLDYAGKYRNLPFVSVLKPEVYA